MRVKNTYPVTSPADFWATVAITVVPLATLGTITLALIAIGGAL